MTSPATSPVTDSPAPASTDEVDALAGFDGLGLSDAILGTLKQLGYSEPTPIQLEAIPPLVGGRDLLGQAATGTGKTAAFALPILERISRRGADGTTRALVLVPTRELAIQVDKAIQGYARSLGIGTLAVFGGQPIGRQIGPLKKGVEVVVATPGRAIDHIKRKTLKLGELEVLVLDEADEMLDMGFADELDAIFESIPEQRQTMLFSATMPPRIESIARKQMSDPVRIQIRREATPEGEKPAIRQVAHLVQRGYKQAALIRVLDVEQPHAAIVFCRTRHEVDQLTDNLSSRGFRAEALHGGMTQEQRDRAMGRLRASATEILVATDVAARGLDVDHLTHVFNYGLPTSAEQYVHRIGRVGRAGREGMAITICEPRERRHINNVERLTKTVVEVRELPTVAELKAKRLEQSEVQMKVILESPDAAEQLAAFKPVIESLSSDHDPSLVSAAALALAYKAAGFAADEREIPGAHATGKGSKGKGYQSNGNGNQGKGAGKGYQGKGSGYQGKGKPGNVVRPSKGKPVNGGDNVNIFFSVGRNASVTPKDLVGAIANEGGISGRQIGTIQVKESFSLVEVPSGAADDVIRSMRSSRIKGRKATIRRERF